jgi:hypothetical protein
MIETVERISCGHCRGRHASVAQVRLCSVRSLRVAPVESVARRICCADCTRFTYSDLAAAGYTYCDCCDDHLDFHCSECGKNTTQLAWGFCYECLHEGVLDCDECGADAFTRCAHGKFTAIVKPADWPYADEPCCSDCAKADASQMAEYSECECGCSDACKV